MLEFAPKQGFYMGMKWNESQVVGFHFNGRTWFALEWRDVLKLIMIQ